MVRCSPEFIWTKAGVPVRFSGVRSADLKNVPTSVWTFLKQYVDRFPGNSPEGLLLAGSVGTGKTSIAAVVLRALIYAKRVYRRAVWVAVPDLLTEIRRTYADGESGGESAILWDLGRADIVVLDDLGKEKPSVWVAEKLYQVVNRLYGDKKPIIVTTEFELEELAVRFGDQEGEHSAGDCIVSRLCEMCKIIRLPGAVDCRLNKLQLL